MHIPPHCDRSCSRTLRRLLLPGLLALGVAGLEAAPFAPGNLVVYRVGTGAAARTSAATEVFLDEYTAAGTLVQSIALPTADDGANQIVTASGTATSEGMITRTEDGRFLVLTGYDAAPATASVTSSASTTVARVVARVGADASIDSSTTTTAFSANNIRAAVSEDGSAFWANGGNTGIVYLAHGGSGAGTIVSSSTTNTRVPAIFGGQLYISSGSGTNTFRGVNAVGTGLPVTTGQTTVRLPGMTDAEAGSVYGYLLADLDAGVAGYDTLYTADDGAGLGKWSLVGGSWIRNSLVGTNADDYRGLTGSVSGATVTLYAVRDSGSSDDNLVSLVDATGYNAAMTATPTLLATAAANTAMRGVAFAPQPDVKLLITEVQSSQASSGKNDFWELTNIGADAVDLGNWKWDDDSRNPADAAAVTIASGTTIAPGESIVFTGLAAATFRTWWNLDPSVQVISTGAAPGLGGSDAVALFDGSGTERAFFSYVAGGFTKSDGSASAGGHAGLSAGGSATASAIWDPVHGTTSPRYKAAVAGNTGAFVSTESSSDVGSPGYSGFTTGSGPSIDLTLSAVTTTFSESAANPASVGTVTRSGATTGALEVSLSSSDATEATVPATVTIPDGQASVDFDITAVNDSFPDGNKTVTITATATGSNPDTLDLTVQDDGDVLDTSFLLTEISSNQSAGSPVDAEDFWELTNISTVTKDISGYTWHDSGRSASTAQAWKLPEGTMIAPGESVIFTATPPASFRTWWNLPPTVQVFQAAAAPGLGQNDGISFFDAQQNELFFFSYAAGGFTKEDGNPSTGTHAGPSAGGSADSQSLVWVPSSGTASPRYTAATGSNLGTFSAVAPATDLGSPGLGNVRTVSLSNNSVTEGNTGTKFLPLTVTRSDTATAFTVDYAVTGGTATSGTDYATLAAGTLTFADGGSATQTINLTIIGDTDAETDETVVVTLSNVVNTTGDTLIGTATGTGTILNDDVIAPNLTLQIGGSTIATGGVTTLRVAATGNPAPTLQWYQGNKGDTSNPISGATSPTLLTSTLAGSTNFWVRASNTGGDFDSDTITVNVVAPVTSVDLSNYVRVGRHSLPEPLLTALPAGTPAHNLLCQEASGVTYNWDTDTLFVVADGGRSVTQVSKTGVLIDTMTLALGSSPQGTEFYDIEGVTYVGGGQFVMSEERDRQLVKFTYAAGTTLTRGQAQTVKIGTFVDNTGTEGLSHDPLTSGFVVLKEISPIGIFQTTVDFALGTASNGSASTVNSTDLFNPALLGMTDVADVFALSVLPSMAGQPQQPNLIVLSQEDGKLVNIDRSGVISSTRQLFSDPGNPLSVAGQQHEGVTMDAAGFLYIVNENGGGGIDFPELWVYAPATAPNAAPTGLSLNGAVTSVIENTSTASALRLGEVVVVDDGLGTNVLGLAGADAAFFELVGNTLFLKAGTVLDFETKSSYQVTLQVDDASLGPNPDATQPFTLTVTDQDPETPPPPALLITEIAPWSSGNSAVGADWFEVTNISASAVDISGWKIDDSSKAFGSAVALGGITSIAPGESVIFLETSDLAGKSALFRSHWFGASPPAALQIGNYTGSGVGFGTSGDAVWLFDSVGQVRAGVTFGASPSAAPFGTFDNTAGLNGVAVSKLSFAGVNGALPASGTMNEIGSPGFAAPGLLRITEVAPWSSGNSPVGADWFEVTNVGARVVSLEGWKMDDGSESPVGAVALNGIAAIAPGESVIFLETETVAATVSTFRSNWFGANPPAGLQVGTYSGSGVGLSSGGDAVNLFDSANVRQAKVTFGASPAGAPFGTFDNSALIDNATVTLFSSAGVNGAFVATNSAIEIGSPGVINKAPEVGGTILTQSAVQGSPFSFVVPAGIFTDPEGQPLTYSATRGDGSPLPAWISFDPMTRTFSGTPGALDAGDLVVKLTATDGGTPGLPTSMTLTIQVPYVPVYTSSGIDVLTPNTGIWNPAGVNVNGSQFVNLGLQGVGRVPANAIDPATGESIGSVSDMQISGWKKNADGSYAGTFHFLPDRGYNSGAIYSNYAARLNDFSFSFTPYTGAAPTTLQNQIALNFEGSRRFTYDHDSNPATPSIFTTGLLATGKVTLFGTDIPAHAANSTQSDGTFANRLTVDAEGLILDSRPSKVGTGWVSDEYGPYIYHFNANGEIDGQVQLPAALVPHNPVGTTSFANAPANLNGRRENQGMEGIAQSPDGTKLFALLQSATLQDGGSGNHNRYNTRLLVYDVSSTDTPSDPVDQYVIQLPRLDTDATPGVDRTGAQSAILALNDHQLLILSRDGNGRGAAGAPVFKSVLLAELNGATDIDGTFDAEAAAVAPGAVLNASVTPLSWTEALNMLAKIDATTQELSRFNLNINAAPGDLNTLGEKWEALSMVSANDPANPNDYFLFIGNDNDFASQTGVYKDAAGVNQPYDSGLENDTVVLAYRVRMTGTDNQAPFNGMLITDQSATKGSAFSLQLPVGTFVDPEGQNLTYSATSGDGSPLPAWLTFDAGTRSFSGTPTAVDLGDIVVRVTATDAGTPPLFTSATFTINVAPAFGSSYFPLSVASGDPRDTSVVLWTRLLDGDTSEDRQVTLHLTTSGSLGVVGTTDALGGANLWSGGNLTADADHDGVVKVLASGLSPDSTYYYQFTYNGNRSPIGRTRTAPAPGTTRTVKYAAINCNDFVGRYFNALKHLCDQEANNIDFVLNLGDYIYETTGDPGFQTSLPDRAMVLSNPAEAIDLGGGNYAAQSVGNYRDVYKTIRQDRQLQRVHELFPMISIWDDHEFSDDSWMDNATYFDGKVAEQQTTRKRNGEQAWMEFLPTSRGLAVSGNGFDIDASDLYPNTAIYDSFNFGGVLDLITTDIRTQRADHLIPEDAFPASVPMDEATLTTVLGAPTWAAVRSGFAPYVNIDDAPYAAVKAVLQAIVAGGVDANLATLPAGRIAATSGAAYAAAKVTGNLDASFINSTFAAAGQPQPFDSSALNAMPRGLSFFLLGKTGFFGEFGSRYQVVDQTFQLYAGYMYQLFVGSGGTQGRDQAFYNSAQQTFLGTALGTSSAAGRTWRVVASSTPYTPIKLELGDLPAGVSLPTQGTLNGTPVPATIPSQFLVEFLLNADEPAGFPQYRQGIIDLLAQHDAIIVSGDIHAQLIGNNLATNGQKVVDFTVPSAASSQFRRAVDSAFGLVESLVGASLGGTFAYDAAQKQAVIDATDAIIKKNTPEMFEADTSTNGYTVFTASPTGFFANYRKIDVSNIDDNLYSQNASALDSLFDRQDLTVTKTGTGPATDLSLSVSRLSPPALLTGPSTTVAPYLTSHLPGVEIQSLLTVGDSQTVPKVGGGTTRLVGIGDGLGAYDNGNGTFTILLNHEITNTQGITRAHGSVGSFVSKWTIDKTTRQVVSGDDLIKQVFTWDGSAFVPAGSPFAFDRLCSADLPAQTALFNGATGNGSSARIYMNGEETSGGRAFAHVVDGPDAGKSYHLAHFGFTNFENVVLSPKAQDKTIAIMTNDSGDGEVFVYIGTKNSTGTTEPEKAGLTGGMLYGMAVPGKPFELAVDASLAVGPTENFTLASIGGPGNYPTGGTDTNNRATAAGVLQLGGPEDGVWDTRPGFEDTFYFVTKGTSSNGINAPTRLWKMEFTDISQPENGGVLSILLDGPALRLGSLDNMTFDDGKLLIQEDLGDDERLSAIWEYDVTTGELQEVAEHRGNYFYTGGANFLTINEESSGIIPLRSILGAGWYAAAVQVHGSSHIPAGDRTELVEGGQLVLLNLGTRERDLVRTPLVQHGDTWRYDATGTNPGATWKDVGFADGGWSSGPSMLGYGDDLETQTDIPAPGTPTTRPAATYFRTTFDVANPADTILLDLYMKWDDGAVVHINGVEVARTNLSRTAAVTHTTFATVNESAERDWKQVSIPCENLNLQATGNVLAISIHQENASSSDTRIDAELFAWSKSPDPGAAPALPTGLAVSNPTNESLDLDWNAQSDAKFFVIERQKAGELTWRVVDGDVPGTFTSYTDLALAGGAEYSYRIWAVNQYGASACTAPQTGTTTNVIVPTIFFEDFSTTTNSSQTGSFTTETGIRTQSLAAGKNWYVAGPFGSIGKVANGNGFGSSPAGEGSDEWLFLPPLNTDFYSGELFSFLSDARFNDTGLAGVPTTVPTDNTGLDVLLSTDYDPAVHTDPRTATWTLLNPQAAFDTDFSGFGSGVASGDIDLSSLQGIATVAFRYRSSGTVSNAARHWEITDLQVLGSAGVDFEISTGLAPFTQISSASSLNWSVATMSALAGARANNFGADAPGDDWLISPAFASVFDDMSVSFDYYERFADLGAIPQGKPLAVLVSTDYNPAIHTNPASATWMDITPAGLDGSVSNAWRSLNNVPLGLTGTNWNVHVAFRYQSSGTGSNATKQVGIDKVAIGRGGGPLAIDFNFTQAGNESTFTPSISGGTEPYTVSWDFGDTGTATGNSPSHIFANNGNYTVTVTVTDAAGASTTATKNVVTNFTEFAIPTKTADLRVATFNTAMNSDDINGNAGDANAVANALASGTHPSIKKVAEVIQRLNPDVVLLNEVDLAYIGQTFDPVGTLARVDDFRTKYLGVAQAGDTSAVAYPYHYIGGTNTGLSSGYDLRNQGGVDTTPGDQGYGDDSFGFGQFPGKYGFVVLSKYPIDTANARTFQKFLWKDMPGALLPEDPADTDGNSSTASFYSPDELNVFRLSSKSHWDVPVIVGGQTVHLLCSHPTPPVFDDGETLTHTVATGTAATKADWNGLRNNDEIRFWADYIDPTKDDYIYDDSEVTVTGTDAAGNQLYTGVPSKQGLGAGESFVIVGDLNADPVDGDSSFAGVTSLTTSTFVDTSITPESTGSLEQVPGSFSDRAQKTSSFNLRADYALPSVAGLDLVQAGVHWPKLGDATSYLLAASDHRSVWVDLDLDGQITIDPIITGGSGGTVTGGGVYAPGSTATFTAVPATGYRFVGWTVNGAPAGTGNPLSVTAAAGLQVEATFAYVLQLLHFADAEAGLLASQTAPNLAALVDAFDDDYANTIILAGGDNYIPGPFAAAGTDAVVAATHNKGNNPFAADIEIHNRIGVQASTIGNHEFDFGSAAFSDAINDTAFPYLSANLDFSGDSAISARYQETVGVGGLEEASTLAKKIVPSAVITVNGEKIGLVGATTQIIETISSTGGVEVKGFAGDGAETNNMTLLASQLQPVIDDLTGQGVNKIVLMAHLQQIALEQSLAPLLTGVDIVLAAGSNTRLGDADDVAVPFTGHAADFAGSYPIVTAGADAKPVLIVNTDNEFTYLGRLVVDFDSNGEIVTSGLPDRVPENGAYAATAANVAAAWGVSEGNLATTAFATGTKGAGVKQITDAVQSVIAAKDGDVKGYTNHYLEGERAFVRNQETNLGNLSADANAFVLAEAAGETIPIVSLKNGGGIRAAIGAVDVVSGAKNPPLANPSAGKAAGGVSLLDIENSMRFNNRLLAFDTTPAGLKAILEHGVAVLGNQGRFPQIGGVSFAYDPARPTGDRITTISLIGEEGQLHDALYDGTFSPWAPPVIRLVTLNFLANGGDGYPMKANGTNFRYLLDDGTLGPVIDPALDFTIAPSLPANALGEQKALADFLAMHHGTPATAYDVADTAPADDLRIQNLSVRSDEVPFDLTLLLGGGGVGSIGNETIASGERQGIRFTLTETRRVEIAGTGSTALTAVLLDENGNVVETFTGPGSLLIGGILPAGDYLLRVSNDTAGDETVSIEVDASGVPSSRPDAAVGKSVTSLTGVNAYGPVETQEYSIVSRKLKPVKAVTTIANRGALDDTLRLRSTPGNRDFAVTHRQGRRNITAALETGRFETGAVNQDDAPVVIQTTITPNKRTLTKTAPRRSNGAPISRDDAGGTTTGRRGDKKKTILSETFAAQITATSTVVPTLSDAVQIRVTTR